MRGVDDDLDHYLVKEKMKDKIKKVNHKKGIVVDKYENTCERFKH